MAINPAKKKDQKTAGIENQQAHNCCGQTEKREEKGRAQDRSEKRTSQVKAITQPITSAFSDQGKIAQDKDMPTKEAKEKEEKIRNKATCLERQKNQQDNQNQDDASLIYEKGPGSSQGDFLAGKGASK